MMTRFSPLHCFAVFLAALLSSLLAHADTQAGTEDHCTPEYLKQNPDRVLRCYLDRPDDSYELLETKTSEQLVSVSGKKQLITLHHLKIVSQQWPVNQEHKVDHPVWEHRITVYQPTTVKHDTALLHVNGGTLYLDSNLQTSLKGHPQNDGLDFAQIAAATQSIVVDLKDVPNQHLQFDDGKPLREDAIVAFTWQSYLGDPEKNIYMPLRLPMVKAIQRAMDTVQSYLQAQHESIRHFVLSGMSKRGWAVWLTPAVDERVTAMVPMVIDVLKLPESMDHHWNSYGFWAPPVRNFKNILPARHSESGQSLLRIVDPIYYVDQLTLPKYIITATADEFFLPDASQHYLGDLKGDTWTRAIPNSGHYLTRHHKSLITDTLTSFYGAILDDTPLPTVNWRRRGNELSASSSLTPKYAKLWTASNAATRDFRLSTGNPDIKRFEPSDLSIQHKKSGYRVKTVVTPPEQGWKASFIEMGFSNQPYKDFIVTTPVFITPDVYPSERLNKRPHTDL